jgi:transposase-like protein
MGCELDADSTSKSAVSRRLVSLTRHQLDAWLARDLSGQRIAVVMVDGIEVAGHTIIVALGINEVGEKQPLGLWDGATENSAVCQSLLDNLVQRGLDPQRADSSRSTAARPCARPSVTRSVIACSSSGARSKAA